MEGLKKAYCKVLTYQTKTVSCPRNTCLDKNILLCLFPGFVLLAFYNLIINYAELKPNITIYDFGILKIKAAYDVSFFKHITQFPEEQIILKKKLFSVNETKKFHYNLFDLTGKKLRPKAKLQNYLTNFYKYSPIYYIFNDVYYHGVGAIITNNTDYGLDRHIHKFGMLKVKMHLDHLIAISAQNSNTYGDFLLGTLSRITLIPEDIISTTPFIFNSDKFQWLVDEYMEIIGIKNYKMIFFNNFSNELIHASFLYTIVPGIPQIRIFRYESYYNQFAHEYIENEFGKIMLKKVGINETAPTRYVVQNRKARMRVIKNFDELFKAIEFQYPNIKFTKLTNNFITFRETILYMSTIKWIMAIGGSNFMNCAFMHEKTNALMICLNIIDNPAIMSCLSRNINLLMYQIEGSIFSTKPLILNIKTALKHVNMSLESI